MDYREQEFNYEIKRLEQTIELALRQLEKAKQSREKKKEDIIEAKKELRENTSHSISNLWNSEQFEALAELGQYVNPVLDKIADVEEVERNILRLEKLIQTPYFARIDFCFEGEEEYESIYIGRSSLKEEKTHEMIIYDWRSPIASVFYRFMTGEVYYDAPVGRIYGAVNQKRQYEIKDSKLEYFFDADVQIMDEFLRKLLAKNTSNKMKAIVETIQKEQDIVIRDMDSELMMVQGVAGSGKTSIALHRVAYLMYQGLSSKLSSSNILILSPNAVFEQYISNVLPELGEQNVTSLVFEELMVDVLQKGNIQSKNTFLEMLLTSSRFQKVMKKSIQFKTSTTFVQFLDRFIADIASKWLVYKDIMWKGQCIASKGLLKKKIVARAGTPIGIKLIQLEEFVIERAKEMHGRLSRVEEMEIKNEIQQVTQINVLELYKKMFHDPTYFYHLCNEFTKQEEFEDIILYTNENLNSSLLSYDDAIVLTYFQIKIFGFDGYKDIKQIVIDEAQDYYPIQYEIFRLLFSNAKFTILGDMNQTLEKQEDISFYDGIQKILNKKKYSMLTMDKSFRCTNEILQYSLKLIEQDIKIKSFNRQGEEPQVFISTNAATYRHKMIEEIHKCQNLGYESIGLICKTQKNVNQVYSSIKDKIEVQVVTDESNFDLKGVFIMPIYLSKGLEFDAVLICDADSINYHSDEDKKLLYIACTRALHRLNLFCKEEVSKLLEV